MKFTLNEMIERISEYSNSYFHSDLALNASIDLQYVSIIKDILKDERFANIVFSSKLNADTAEAIAARRSLDNLLKHYFIVFSTEKIGRGFSAEMFETQRILSNYYYLDAKTYANNYKPDPNYCAVCRYVTDIHRLYPSSSSLIDIHVCNRCHNHLIDAVFTREEKAFDYFLQQEIEEREKDCLPF